MTQILQEYIRIREQENDYNKNLIEISFIRLDYKNTTIPEFPTLETVGSYVFDCLKIHPSDALEIDYLVIERKSKYYWETA